MANYMNLKGVLYNMDLVSSIRCKGKVGILLEYPYAVLLPRETISFEDEKHRNWAFRNISDSLFGSDEES